MEWFLKHLVFFVFSIFGAAVLQRIFLYPFLSIHQGVQLVTFFQNANRKQQLVYDVFSGYCIFTFQMWSTPVSPPSQPVSQPENNSLAQAISMALAESLPSLLSSSSRFQWRERKRGHDICSAQLGFKFNTVSSILELWYSLLYLPVFKHACCALTYFNL